MAVLGVLITSAVVDASDFGTQEAWFYVTLLTIGYIWFPAVWPSPVHVSPTTTTSTADA